MNKKEKDYRFKSILSVGQDEFEVECDLILPKSVYENPIVLVHFRGNDIHMVMGLNSYINLKGSNGQDEILVEKAYIESGGQQYWGEGESESHLYIVPEKLVLTNKTFNSGLCEINFQLTNSRYLDPIELLEMSYEGTMTVMGKSKYKSFNLDSEKTVQFINHYEWEQVDSKDIRTSKLIAKIKYSNSRNLANQISESIDLLSDYLLLISFFEGVRVMFNRYEIHDDQGVTKVFLMNKLLPIKNNNHSINDFIIYPNEIDMKIKKNWEKFCHSNYKKDLRNAIYGHISESDNSGEIFFLRYFSTIETLCSIHRKKNQMSYIFEPSSWGVLKKAMKRSIKSSAAYDIKVSI